MNICLFKKMAFLGYAGTLLKRPILCRLLNLKRNIAVNSHNKLNSVASKTIHDVNTNVARDVILYKYENPKFYMYMNVFAIVQYIFWTYLGLFAFKSLKDAPVDRSTVDENTPWYRKINLGENKYKNTLSTIAVIIGTGSLTMVWMYTLKSVRYLILNKGGRHITFVTYSPFGKNRMMKVPIENVCCKENRRLARVQLPLKVKDTFMHYMLDMRGEFKNTLLFDSTAGLKRVWH